MKLAIIGSRSITVKNIEDFLPEDTEEIVSGGARGVDRAAAEYAKRNGIRLVEFLPDYARYGRGAPLKRNALIAAYADMVLAFWDGESRGTAHTLSLFEAQGKRIKIVKVTKNDGVPLSK